MQPLPLDHGLESQSLVVVTAVQSDLLSLDYSSEFQ
jgi:hypothetical protein